jgi:N-acetylmuramoyl-L-alanine amidase
MYKLIALFLLFVPLLAQAQQVDIRGARIWTAPDQTRLVVDAAAPVSHKIFPLEKPDRLVIDIPDARLRDKLPTLEAGEPLLIRLRSGIREGDDLRLVLDLKRKVRAKSFLLRPNEKYGYRLVVDLVPAGSEKSAKEPAKAVELLSSIPQRLRDVVVAIDAGHGGEDPGAIGAKGTREKDVTLQVARSLARLMKKQPGMAPVLVRDGDYFIPLRKRMSASTKRICSSPYTRTPSAIRGSAARPSIPCHTVGPAARQPSGWRTRKTAPTSSVASI